MAHGIAGRIARERGEASVDLAGYAVRSVATGVLGVATLQAILAAIGLVLADVPGFRIGVIGSTPRFGVQRRK